MLHVDVRPHLERTNSTGNIFGTWSKNPIDSVEEVEDIVIDWTIFIFDNTGLLLVNATISLLKAS